MTQVVKRAKIALLGATIPILNPVRVAEEFAMLDTMSGGRVIAGMLRGTPNEYVTYNINPTESRAPVRRGAQPHQDGVDGDASRSAGRAAITNIARSRSGRGRCSSRIRKSTCRDRARSPSEFAARNRVGLGLAFTNVPQAKQSVDNYREHADARGLDAGAG